MSFDTDLIDVKILEKTVQGVVLDWIPELEDRLDTIENNISSIDRKISDLDGEVIEMRNEEVDWIKKMNYFIDKMRMFFGSHHIWNENDDSSKKMLKRFFEVYHK